MARWRIAALLATALMLACLTVSKAQANSSATIGDGSAMAMGSASGPDAVEAGSAASTTGGTVTGDDDGCPEGTMASASASAGDDVSTASACVPIEDTETTTDGGAPDSSMAMEEGEQEDAGAAGAAYVSLAAIAGGVVLGMAAL